MRGRGRCSGGGSQYISGSDLRSMDRVILPLLLAATAIGYVSAVNCTGLANGHYEVACRAYAVCAGGQVHRVDCPRDTVYNNNTASCQDPAHVAPPCGILRDCTGKADGLYADVDQNCHSYYTCLDDNFLGHNLCAAGLVFDYKISACNWPKAVERPCGTAPVG